MDTGFTSQDAQSDFNRSRRRAALGRADARLRGQAGDVTTLLPFEEVVEALGRTGERRLGLQTIELDSIVGSVDRTTEFDRRLPPAHRPGAGALAADQRGAAPRHRGCRRSTSSGSAACTSSRTAITASRSPATWAST